MEDELFKFKEEYRVMFNRISSMTNEELKSTWDALLESWNDDGMYSDNVTMLEWCENIYSEMCKRNVER